MVNRIDTSSIKLEIQAMGFCPRVASTTIGDFTNTTVFTYNYSIQIKNRTAFKLGQNKYLGMLEIILVNQFMLVQNKNKTNTLITFSFKW